MADVGEFHTGRPKRSSQRAGGAGRVSRKKRRAVPNPQAAAMEVAAEALATEAAQPDTTLAELLTKRVRISLANDVRWVSGYTILATQLRRRAVMGEARALQLLDRLDRYHAGIKTKGAAHPGAGLQTRDERELSKAFIKRTLESVAAQSAYEPPATVVRAPAEAPETPATTGHRPKQVRRSRRPVASRSRRTLGRNRIGRDHVTK